MLSFILPKVSASYKPKTILLTPSKGKGVGQSFQCTLCGNVYARNQFLQAHGKREHNYCEEQFSYEVKRLRDYAAFNCTTSTICL